MKISKKSEMELSFPLVDTFGIPISLDGSVLTGKLKKKIRLGYGAVLPLDSTVYGVVDRTHQRATLTGSVLDRLSFVLRHDDPSASESLWFFDATGIKALTDENLRSDDEWFDHLFSSKGALVKFKRSPHSKKWVRV